MPIYHVVWQIEVTAANKMEAAGKALIIQRDPRNPETMFEVSEQDANDYDQISIDPQATYYGLLNLDLTAQTAFDFDGSDPEPFVRAPERED